jgi:methylmalonyl-CoA mutase N-terminal domain/subunit
MTNKLEQGAYEYFKKIDALGGMVKAIEQGYPQREIAHAAYQYQKALEKKEKIMVGVNDFTMEGEKIEIPILKIDYTVEQEQHRRLEELRKKRDNMKVKKFLDELKQVSQSKENVMPLIIEAARAYASLGEICGAMKEIFGTYREPPIF